MARPVQRFEQVVVSALAHVDAPVVVTSAELDAQVAPVMERFGMHPGVLEGLAGIAERRFQEPGVLPSQAATGAAELALAAVPDVCREDVGAVINTSVCRDYIEPSTACFVHERLGLSAGALNFDLGNACLGFLNGMSFVAGLIERGDIDHGLVVDGEDSRFAVESTVARLLDPATTPEQAREQFATLTLGSGAVAMLLSRADLVEGGHPYRGGVFRAATQHNALCIGNPDEMRTQHRELLVAGLSFVKETFPEADDAFGLLGDDVAAYAIHQVSKVHTEALCDTVGIAAEKVPLLYPRFGNVGPAGIPMTVSKEADAGRLSSGDRIGLIGIGSGLNCAMTELVW